MSKLEDARKEINRIDAEMAALFEERMKASETIAAHKKENGLSIRDYAREKDLISKNIGYIKNPDIEPYYVKFIKSTIDISCEYQSKLMSGLKVAYCGTIGAFAYIAAKKMFPEAELIAFTDFADAYEAVENGKYDCAVLPLENSYAGEVGAVMDLMFSGELYVNQVLDVPIVHDLVACKGTEIGRIKKVISHPQALSQCSEYIREHSFASEAYSNTALAAKYVKELNDPTVAAIASSEAVDEFGLEILDQGINDSKNNTTRFASFSRVKNLPAHTEKHKDENFLLVFTVKNEAGSLAGALNIIGAHGFNMRSLRSRPMKELEWNYYFYVEAEGNINTENGNEMLRELSAVCAKVKTVGSYYADDLK